MASGELAMVSYCYNNQIATTDTNGTEARSLGRLR